MIIQGIKNKWEIVIGLEIHIQLKSNSKLFSYSSTNFGQESNEQVSFIDSAMPGTLPVTNKKCIEMSIKAGLALDATINAFSIFDRKNYFYPDLPQGYQISQFFYPIASNGHLVIKIQKNKKKCIKINRIHIEQDAGKNIHKENGEFFVDLNRAGIPLIEIVTKPDFTDPDEVIQFIKKLRYILKFIGVCDGHFETGSMRCDANISVKKQKDSKLGTRVEIKNLNSLKNIRKSILYEGNRQVKLLEDSQKINQETRLFDAFLNKTKSMRKKEGINDYKYFPDPDLLPIKISREYIEFIKQNLPELPELKIKKYITSYNITNYNAEILTADIEIAAFFEEIVDKINPQLTINWICVELFGRLNKVGIEFSNSFISSQNFYFLLKLISSNNISGKIAKKVLNKMFVTSNKPQDIINKFNLLQISNSNQVVKFVNNILFNNSKKINDYIMGKKKLFSFFIGQIMKISEGKANPQSVNTALIKTLKFYL